MTEQKTNAGQGLGIAGLVLGILAIPLGIIPCTFIVALIFGAVGIVLSSIGLSQATRNNAAKGIIIAALVCSILGTSFALFWGLALGKGTQVFHKALKEEFRDEFGKELEEAVKEFGEEMEDAFEEFEDEIQEDVDTLEEKFDEEAVEGE